DTKVVAEKFACLAVDVAKATDSPQLSVYAIAEGFLRIAVDNMANAIKKISVQRGHDVTKYTLQCFGGAGGQHACLVADALGMERVFLHPFAGVLSAYGMGLAEIRSLQQVQVDVTLSNTKAAIAALAKIRSEAEEEVRSQGIDQIKTEARAYLRYDGSHQALDVPFSSAATMKSAFESAHESRFGFISPEREVFFDMVSVEAIGATGESPRNIQCKGDGKEIGEVAVYADGALRDIPIYNRDSLPTGCSIVGPAIIKEATGTNVLETGWTGHVDAWGNLILERNSKSPKASAAGTSVDPILLEVFNNLLMSVADQMGATLANTSWSVNIKERLDFSCAIFDQRGDLVANAPHVPVHLGSMSDSIKTVMREFAGAVHPGDAYVLNSPFNGGTHLPDITVVTPIHVGDQVAFWLGSRGHHADVGGRTPGSAPPDSTHIEEEGVLIDNIRLVKGGQFQEADAVKALSAGRYPCRNITQNLADLKAQVAANETGRRELLKVVDHYSLDVVQAYMGHVQDNAEESVRQIVGTLGDGKFNYKMDHGAVIRVNIKVDRQAREAVIDFTVTSGQHSGNYNAPFSICRAVVLYVFRTMVGADIPLNEGCLKPLKIIAPPGSMLNPSYPAAVISGNTEVSQAMCNALYGALGVLACSQGTMNNFVWGNEKFQNYETIAGGTGAGPGFDGCDAVQSHMTNTRMTDPEILEKRFPVRLEEFSIRRNSGGAGKWRGGDGVYRRLRFLEPVTVTTLCSHRIVPPFGVDGGQPGSVGRNQALLPDGTVVPLKGNDEIALPADGVFEMFTPGGGGWGAPET
ncbi:MAG: hydantoinase B/oxoprolinase family protein, partial [Paracoccaceae bacterium]